MHRRRGSAPAVILQQQFSKLNNWPEKSGFHSEDGKKEKSKAKKSPKGDFQLMHNRVFDDAGTPRTFSDPTIHHACSSAINGNGNNNHISLTKRPSSPTLVVSDKLKLDKGSVTRLTIRGHDSCSVEIPNNTRNNLKKTGSIKDYHIVLLGQGGVGKSALLVRFSTGRFIYEYHPTLEMNYEMLAEIDDEIGDLHILDTANTTEPVYLNEGQGFIVIYSINDRMSFETAKQLVKLIREVKKAKGSSIVLVGNKVDLKYDRVVPRKEGRNFAVESECTFYETSAMNNTNVTIVFHDLVKQMRTISKKNGRMNTLKNFFKQGS